MFRLINTCTSAKEAWSILEVAYEGTSKVKLSCPQILSSKFEALRMSEDETMAAFNVCGSGKWIFYSWGKAC